MDESTITTGVAGGSGLVGIILGYVRFNSRIKNVEKNIKDLRKETRLDKTCNEITGGIKTQLKDIKNMNTEMRKDIKELLRK